MSASPSGYTTPMFWERLRVGASADALVAFYDGDRTRILIAAVIYGLAVPHRIIEGGIGHNLPQEAPQAFAQAVVDVDGY